MTIKEWVANQGPALWWKAAVVVFVTGTLYANLASGLSDHDQRTKEIGGAIVEHKKSLDQIAQDGKSTKEIMQQMLRVSKAACLNTAKNDQARLACIGE